MQQQRVVRGRILRVQVEGKPAGAILRTILRVRQLQLPQIRQQAKTAAFNPTPGFSPAAAAAAATITLLSLTGSAVVTGGASAVTASVTRSGREKPATATRDSTPAWPKTV